MNWLRIVSTNGLLSAS